MKFGYFDDQNKEYVITTPQTPLPWINYLGSEDFFSLVSNTAGGYSFYRDARMRRLTRYRYNNSPLDMDGHRIYIKDGETVWNPGWQPTKTPLDSYSCRHGLGYTILEGKKDYDTWQQGYLRIFEDLNANKPFIMNVYRSISREKVENYLYRITYDLLIHVINEKAKGMNVRDEDKKFLANFYKYAFVGLVLDWIKHDMKDDPNIIVADLSVAIHGSVSAALERYRNA